MKVICNIPAVFVNSYGESYILNVNDIGKVTEVPKWVMDTMLYKWLLKDGKLQHVEEQDIVIETAPVEEKVEPVAEQPKEEEPKPTEEEKEPVVVVADVLPVEEEPKKSTRKRKSEMSD